MKAHNFGTRTQRRKLLEEFNPRFGWFDDSQCGNNSSHDLTFPDMNLDNISYTNSSGEIGQDVSWASGPFPLEFSFFAFSIAAIGFFGNLIVLGIILGIPTNRKPANYLLVNLSIGSLLFIFTIIVKSLEKSGFFIFPISRPTCHFNVFYSRLSISIVALTTMAISLERSRVAMSPPLMNPSGKSIIYRIALVWTCSILLTLPRIFMISFNPNAKKQFCLKILLLNNKVIHIVYLTIQVITVHIAPAFILLIETIRMRSKIKFLLCKVRRDVLENVQQYRGYAGTRLRLVRNACIFTTIFFVGWLPFGVCLFPYDLGPEIIPNETRAYVYNSFSDAVYVSGMTLVCLTPIILFLLSNKFREKILPCRHCCDRIE